MDGIHIKWTESGRNVDGMDGESTESGHKWTESGRRVDIKWTELGQRVDGKWAEWTENGRKLYGGL